MRRDPRGRFEKKVLFTRPEPLSDPAEGEHTTDTEAPRQAKPTDDNQTHRPLLESRGAAPGVRGLFFLGFLAV